ncbi:hypothetical protein [Cytobacillus oceanisediminis]|uniref:hypothetical protein n=1 Tax=Cytobacillus oceanisediminis TaxID=665099 RepID=UPI001FB4D018|nr:hypothetical protein [Cytobacillus oceanisediminis]UOE58115.1 hypothetical protein IRB79_26775 [Cytobacillus oceanisediminis]
MGDLADDCYDWALQEYFTEAEDLQYLTNSIDNQIVVNDIISSFINEPPNQSLDYEVLARDILQTAAKTKRLSFKQKYRLVQVLYNRNHERYGCL